MPRAVGLNPADQVLPFHRMRKIPAWIMKSQFAWDASASGATVPSLKTSVCGFNQDFVSSRVLDMTLDLPADPLQYENFLLYEGVLSDHSLNGVRGDVLCK